MTANNTTKPDLLRKRKLAGLAVFTMIIVVLQILCTFVRFSPFSITLALVPVIIGAAVYGSASGAYLGFVMGLVVLFTGIFGWDGGTMKYLISFNSFAVVVICLLKSTVAGWASGAVYKLLARKSILLGVIAEGIVCPIVNTGLFILLMSLFFRSTLEVWAGGSTVMHYLVFSLTGVNFLVELLVNLALASFITRILKSGIKKLRVEKQ